MPINGAYTPNDLLRVKKAILYIEQHYTDTIPPDQLAMEVTLRVSHLQALMQFVTGMTVHQYHVNVRVGRAKEDLADFDKPVKAIARKHGFKSSSQFCRAFKELNRITPKEHRLRLLRMDKRLAAISGKN